MSELLPLNFPASGKYDAILDSFVTTTTTMHVRAAKTLFGVIMHKVYSLFFTVPIIHLVYPQNICIKIDSTSLGTLVKSQ